MCPLLNRTPSKTATSIYTTFTNQYKWPQPFDHFIYTYCIVYGEKLTFIFYKRLHAEPIKLLECIFFDFFFLFNSEHMFSVALKSKDWDAHRITLLFCFFNHFGVNLEVGFIL